MTSEGLRTKLVHSQPKAREKAKISESREDKDYTKQPKKQSDQSSDAKKQNILEENDYAGVRPIDDERTVTEKGKQEKRK